MRIQFCHVLVLGRKYSFFYYQLNSNGPLRVGHQVDSCFEQSVTQGA